MKKLYDRYRKYIHVVLFYLVITLLVIALVSQRTMLLSRISQITSSQSAVSKKLSESEKKYTALASQDQFKRNNDLQEEMRLINTNYKDAALTYEQLVDLKLVQKTDALDVQFASILKQLADKNYASAGADLLVIKKDIKTETDKIAAKNAAQPVQSPGTPNPLAANVTASNTPPGSGFSRQSVTTDIGSFTIDIIAGDLGSTRVIVDTASDSDCGNGCPVLSLGDYVSRNGAYAGVNGSYFCPESYPSCAGKTNSFDLLVMNKNKHYFNSDNNVYSTNPAVIFLGGSVRFVRQASEWGRDTGADGVLSNYPLLVAGGNIVFNGDGDPKKGSKGSRSFVANKGNTVYIGVVQNATVAEAGHALKGLGMENAMNLDSGGSTALWSGGYKAGPGRNIPNAILFVRK
ncbi:hypothetical protein BH11PAT1_BH11PAT1_3520 [soil metagenome]